MVSFRTAKRFQLDLFSNEVPIGTVIVETGDGSKWPRIGSERSLKKSDWIASSALLLC